MIGATQVLPPGVAFSAIARMPPDYGFYAATVPRCVVTLLGSSRQAVSDATRALSALVFGSPEFISAAISMAFLVGLFQRVMGFMQLVTLLDFLAYSVMTRFEMGAVLVCKISPRRPRYLLALTVTTLFGIG
ncbi:hypothetical protein FGG78_18145 [Thioclava sp. BHET1]|nr:hypothetical protein FGG78_18145 [Thioclava sp. BHET1]